MADMNPAIIGNQDPTSGLSSIGSYTPDQWEQLTIGRARIIAWDMLIMMRHSPGAHKIAWDAAKGFARLLFPMAKPDYTEEYAHLQEEYAFAVESKYQPDAVVEQLFDLANLEMARQGRSGKPALETTIAQQFVSEMQ